MGNFDINLSDDDEATLKGLAKDTAYSRLAGGFQQYASGEMMKGAGEGMAKGGGATGGAFIAAGMGLGGQAAAPAAGRTAAAPRPRLRRGRRRDSPAPERAGADARRRWSARAATPPMPRGPSSAPRVARRWRPPRSVCANCQAENPAGRPVLQQLRPAARSSAGPLPVVRHRGGAPTPSSARRAARPSRRPRRPRRR